VSGADLRWSSDGRRRAWGCDLEPDPYGELEALCFTLQPGGAVQRIRSLGLIHRPALSPDGWRVAYSGPGGEYIGVVGPRRRAVLLRHDNGEEPAVDGALSWSPDGRRIAYSAGDAVYVLGATGGRARRVAGTGWNPAWSPDGRRIAFVARGLWTSRPDGTGARRVRRSPVQSCGDSFTAPSCGPVWSRDGRMLYYLAPS
jgi:Tol biopolymer transport system component